jgi:hypothetical protein
MEIKKFGSPDNFPLISAIQEEWNRLGEAGGTLGAKITISLIDELHFVAFQTEIIPKSMWS